MARKVTLGAKRRAVQVGKEEQGKKGARGGGAKRTKAVHKDDALDVNKLEQKKQMAKKKDIPQQHGSSAAKRGVEAEAGEQKKTPQDPREKKTRRGKTPEVSQTLGAPASEDAIKKPSGRGSRGKGLITSPSKVAAPKKTVKRVSARSPVASVPRAAGIKKGARLKKGGTAQPSGDVTLKKGGARNSKVKAQASAGSVSDDPPKEDTRAQTLQAPVPSAAPDVGKKRGRKKQEAEDSAGGADQSPKPEGSNKRRKASVEQPRSPSRRPGLRNSDNHEEPNGGVKRKSAESEGDAPAKKRKVGNKETSTAGESTKAEPGNGNGPRRSSRNVKAESGNPPFHTIQENLSPRAKDGARPTDDDSEKFKVGPISPEVPEDTKESESGLVREDEGSKEGSELKVTNLEPGEAKEAEAEIGDEKNMTGEAGETNGKGGDESNKIYINRAPVLTLWVAVVAEREGFTFEEGSSFGKAISGIYAQAKGKRLGVIEDSEKRETRQRIKEDLEQAEVFGTKLSTKRMPDGHLLAVDASGKPITPDKALAYLKRAFGSNFDSVKGAMETLAKAYSKEETGRVAYKLYEKFRPAVPEGGRGWGTKGVLDLSYLSQLTQEENDC